MKRKELPQSPDDRYQIEHEASKIIDELTDILAAQGMRVKMEGRKEGLIYSVRDREGKLVKRFVDKKFSQDSRHQTIETLPDFVLEKDALQRSLADAPEILREFNEWVRTGEYGDLTKN